MEIENLLNELGDRFRNLTWHKSSNEWTATGIPINSGDKCKDWKPKKIMRGGKNPKEALIKLYNSLFLNSLN